MTLLLEKTSDENIKDLLNILSNKIQFDDVKALLGKFGYTMGCNFNKIQ